MIRLYDYELSGNCFKVRQMLAWLGLAYSGEFPVRPYGPDGIHPYGLVLPISSDSLALEGPLGMSPNWRNRDVPEAYVEAIYQAITGEGLGTFIEPAFGCASGGHGGACFRDDALSVIVLVADAPLHNGPVGVPPTANYDPTLFLPGPAPHLYADLVRVATEQHVRVVTVGIHHPGQPSPFPHLQRLSTDTGAVDADGRVLSFDAGSDGSAIDTGIVTAIQQLADGLPVDVSARVQDVTGDAIDARTLVTAVVPLSADPPSGVASIDAMKAVCLGGPGHYLGSDQTLQLMQTEYVYPAVGNRMSPKEWNEAGKPLLLDAAIARKNEILAKAGSVIDPELDLAIRKAYNIYFR
mgnify:CR=1 FL=1